MGVNIGQRVNVLHRHALIDLMNGRADKAKFNHGRVIGDIARVRCSARGRQFRLAANDIVHGLLHRIGKASGISQESFSGNAKICLDGASKVLLDLGNQLSNPRL